MSLISNKKGFSLIEFVITTIILTIISTLTSASIRHLKSSNRNAQRVADVMEIQDALEMYYRDQGNYPLTITPGASLEANGVIYLARVPSNPSPRDDGDCPDQDYSYVPEKEQASYRLTFCISRRSADIGPGINIAKPGEIVSCLPNCVNSCKTGDNTGDDGCGNICENAVDTCPSGQTCLYNHCISDL